MMTDQWTAADFSAAALLTIDVQLDTLDGQAFEIPGTSAALPEMARLCAAFRQAERPVFHVLRLYRPDGSNAELCRRSPLAAGQQFFLAGSSGRRIAPALLPAGAPDPDDEALLNGELQPVGEAEWYVYKPRWGAFYGTPLQAKLEALQVNTVVIVGCNYPNCVRATVYEASARDFRVMAIKGAISNFTPHGWEEMANIGINVAGADDCARELLAAGGKYHASA
ncbi:MAG: isochorismatase family cysteine hydrolase [Gammaproteobacteria bacterium]|jgi:nicotinamidase-related amidase|nr:isochorismatase family cysteine hydrolase [Gammaproteobacteria bacterium]